MGAFYNLFSSYGDLTSQLSGLDGAGNPAGNDLFLNIGIITIVVVFVICLAYYYFWNHPRLNRTLRWWGISVITAFLGNLILFLYLVFSVSDNAFEGLTISTSDCLKFTVVNTIATIFGFLVCSFIIHWWSGNNRYSPFIKF